MTHTHSMESYHERQIYVSTRVIEAAEKALEANKMGQFPLEGFWQAMNEAGHQEGQVIPLPAHMVAISALRDRRPDGAA